jgi:hypothetical protein
MQSSHEEKRKPGRPPVIFKKCLEEMRKLTEGMNKVTIKEIVEIKTKLKSLGYNEKMIKKARIALGYKAIFDEFFQSWFATKEHSYPPKLAQLKIDLAPATKVKVDPRY